MYLLTTSVFRFKLYGKRFCYLVMNANINDTLQKLKYKDFENKKVLGEGFFNQVYCARHPNLGPCVLKIVSRAFYANER